MTYYYDESSAQQENVFMEALSIFIDRNKKYKDTWRQFGAMSNLVRTAQKIDRLMAVWWHDDPGQMSGELQSDIGESDLDDAYDVINHMAFFIRCVKERSMTGSPPLRPPGYSWPCKDSAHKEMKSHWHLVKKDPLHPGYTITTFHYLDGNDQPTKATYDTANTRSAMLWAGKHRYVCKCGSSVFTATDTDSYTIYRCNGCGHEYSGRYGYRTVDHE